MPHLERRVLDCNTLKDSTWSGKSILLGMYIYMHLSYCWKAGPESLEIRINKPFFVEGESIGVTSLTLGSEL